MRIFIFLFSFNFFFSQVSITGKVIDENKEPIFGVSVFFDGSTIGTSTNEQGIFILNYNNLPQSTLVLRFLGYETVYLNEFDKIIIVQLKPKLEQLDEIVLESPPFTRKQMLAAFRDNFIGTTKSAKNCKIVNEDVISFSYDSKQKILTVYADEPVKVFNNYLGYSIDFQLIDFVLKYSNKTLSNEWLTSSYFSGTSFFSELQDSSKTIIKNRKKAYLGSLKHFFKNLINNKWGKRDFLLFDGNFLTNPSEHFQIIKSQNFYEVKLLKNKIISNEGEAITFLNYYNILYDNSEQSKIVFKTPEFFIDEFGNNSHIHLIQLSGEFSKRKVGDMLPLDYDFEN